MLKIVKISPKHGFKYAKMNLTVNALEPGQFHVDSGNLNFIKICWELAEEIANIRTHTTSKFIY